MSYIYMDVILPDELTLAAMISLVFHPLITPTPAGVIILWLGGLKLSEAVGWVSLCAAIVVLPLVIHIAVMKVLWGHQTSVRENRYQLYVTGIALTGLLLFVLHQFDAPQLLLASIYAGCLSGIIGSVVNLWKKISLHTGVSTGITVVLFILSPLAGFLAGLLTVTVAGSRWKMDHHDITELAAGAVVPTIGGITVFRLFEIPIL